jgi:predicted NBD/HSP70 family sugar kinase
MSEANFLGSNINQVKEHNLRAILRLLLYEEAFSRVGLAKKTALSATTITNLVDELIEKQIVVECEDEFPLERRGVGRPRSRLCLVPRSRYAMGVHIRVGVFRVALVDLLGQVVDHIEVEFASSTPARQVIEDIAHASEKILLRQNNDRGTVLGIGVGASGLVNYRTGVNMLAANFGWSDVSLRDPLAELLHLSVVVDNNVRCMALGEAMFGTGRGITSLAFVYGRFGVGAGIVVDGKVFRGSGQGAGEIGHTIIIPHNGPLCRCGQRGCLETLVSEPTLIHQAEVAASLHPGSILERCMQVDTDSQKINRLFTAYREGDQWAKELVETSAEYLGIALANLVNLINPELILLGGMFAEEQEIFLPIARRVMVTNSFGGLGEKVRLEGTRFGRQAGMIGAASLALAKFLYLNPEDA